MNTQIKKEIIRLAEENPLEEICGFIYYTFDAVKLFPCNNIESDKSRSFEISKNDYLNCLRLGKICGVYHSHALDDSAFTKDDIESADEIALPLYVYSLIDKKFQEYIPKNYILPLEGLPFIIGLFDCYEMMRIYFRQNYNIYPSDYDRDESYHNDHTDIIANNFEKEGFHKSLDTFCLTKNDVLVFSSNLARPQHFGVFLGNSKILDHKIGRLSGISYLNMSNVGKLKYVLKYKTPL
jgi:proteasome lid subunit RPN8/RPN11